jgi:hypothetical protein
LNANACGPGAVCRNLDGGYECSCLPGHEGDPRVGCYDNNECSRASCGRGAICENLPGAFRCVCPPGFEGDPNSQCMGKPTVWYESGCDYSNNFVIHSLIYRL